MSTIELPPIQLNKLLPHLTEDEYALVSGIVRQGRLKATKLTIKYQYVEKGSVRIKRPDDFTGRMAYLWAAIAYYISPYKRDLAAPPDYRMYLTDEESAVRLNEVADMICKNVPKQYHYGKIARGANQ